MSNIMKEDENGDSTSLEIKVTPHTSKKLRDVLFSSKLIAL